MAVVALSNVTMALFMLTDCQGLRVYTNGSTYRWLPATINFTLAIEAISVQHIKESIA